MRTGRLVFSCQQGAQDGLESPVESQSDAGNATKPQTAANSTCSPVWSAAVSGVTVDESCRFPKKGEKFNNKDDFMTAACV